MAEQQKWKTDPSLYDAPTKQEGLQTKKNLDYENTYVDEFLNKDPLRDWESIDRCIWLWEWSQDQLDNPKTDNWSVLDVGTKDAQFPQWLRDMGVLGVGIEISEPYIKYATEKGRPIYMGNACDMTFADNQFNYVFSHHLHGLLPDYLKGLQEMFRVTNKYMIALNQVPGNQRKHYSYIETPQIYEDFVQSIDCNVIYNDFLETGFSNEWVCFIEKKLPEGFFHGPDLPKPDFDVTEEEAEVFFKRKKK
jgi:SAM-dependent methyltransferase